MENDYYDISHKIFVDSVLEKYNFSNDYKEAGGWGCRPRECSPGGRGGGVGRGDRTAVNGTALD
jgi:hypothetical protein